MTRSQRTSDRRAPAERRRAAFARLGVSVLAVALGLAGGARADEPLPTAVERRLADQDARIRALERELEALRGGAPAAPRPPGEGGGEGEGGGGDGAERAASSPSPTAPAAPAASTPPPASGSAPASPPHRASPPGGAAEPAAGAEAPAAEPWTARVRLGLFSIESADGAFRLDIGGRIQVDSRHSLGRRDGSTDDTFEVRRGRVELDLRFHERIEVDLGLEFGRTSDADLRNAFIRVVFADELQLMVGQMLLPFSDVRFTSSNYLHHPERPILPASIVKDRDVGAELHGELFGGGLTYMVGVFNGEGQNRLDGDDDVDFAARLVLQPVSGLWLSASYIYSPTDRDKAGPLDLRTVGDEAFRFLAYADDNRRLGRRQRLSGGARFVAGPFALEAEVDVDHHREVESALGARADLLNWTWLVDAIFVFTGEGFRARPSGLELTPARPAYDPETGALGPGAWAIAVRYEDVLIDPATLSRGFAEGTDRARAVASTVHWYLWKNVRFSLSYTYTDFEQSVIDDRGRPHEDDHAILGRFAVFF